MIRVDNLYRHEDGGLYCLLSPEAPMKCPVTAEWIPGVIYTGPDGLMRSTSRDRWDRRFAPVAEIAEKDLDESQLMMIRRCNPGNQDFDFIRVFESWHESEMSITGHMLELAVAAAMESFYWGGAKRSHENMTDGKHIRSAEITIMTEDLQRVLQTYEIERVPIPHGFTFRMSKSS